MRRLIEEGEKAPSSRLTEMDILWLRALPTVLKMWWEKARGADGEDGQDGKDGHTPTKEELRTLIKPLIPAPLKGEKGDVGPRGEDADLEEVRQIVEVRTELELKKHEEKFKHELIHDSHVLGEVTVEDGGETGYVLTKAEGKKATWQKAKEGRRMLHGGGISVSTVASRMKLWQTVTPATDGAVTQFTIGEAIIPGTLKVYRDGLRISATEDSITQFTLGDAPLAVEEIRVDYISAS